jgi:hypothetical protein
MIAEIKTVKEKIKALDELFAASATYRMSQNFFDLLNFINKFPSLSPFNAFLIHMQNRGVELVMTASRWKKHGRQIKNESRPLVILVPFGPVEFVYDIADTEGDPIPDILINPFSTVGDLEISVFDRTIRNCLKDNIKYLENQMHKTSAGYASGPHNGVFRIVVNITYPLINKYSTLIHELGHIYCGHLGVLNESWWKPRILGDKSVEIEAEAISYLVCKRRGLQTTSERYLCEYIKENEELPPISLDVILTVAGYIEQLGQQGFKPKKK